MSTPELSVVLATDTYATIRPVVDRFRRQTIRDRIELILIAPSADKVSGVMAHRDEFAAIQIVEDPVADLAPARAAGIRAASAPYVFVGETHSYPHPEFAEALVRRLSESWTAVAPAFGNANPNGPRSWAGFLSDYGRWVDGTEAGEVTEFPIYNVGVRRDRDHVGDHKVTSVSRSRSPSVPRTGRTSRPRQRGALGALDPRTNSGGIAYRESSCRPLVAWPEDSLFVRIAIAPAGVHRARAAGRPPDREREETPYLRTFLDCNRDEHQVVGRDGRLRGMARRRG